jgi:hypothetical protein
MTRHYKFRWEESGDDRENCWDYWEIDAGGDFTRSVHVYDDGRVLRYDKRHAADAHGMLPEGTLNLDELTPEERATVLPISREEFEEAWSRPALNRAGDESS